ncbi:MAG TPA: DnaJ family domain-containing protein [Anaerolineales bacterium]|nr:DnaJ family domain-containing protein [Anaerolineales bacterium]
MADIEEHIRRAIEEGKFENLPGKGKPLHLDENPFEDPDWRMANRVLRNAGFTLPFLEVRREIENTLAAARHDLKRSWDWRNHALGGGIESAEFKDQWNRSVEKFREQIALINKQIASYNLQTPSDRFQLPPINVERELQLTTSDQSDTLPGT